MARRMNVFTKSSVSALDQEWWFRLYKFQQGDLGSDIPRTFAGDSKKLKKYNMLLWLSNVWKIVWQIVLDSE